MEPLLIRPIKAAEALDVSRSKLYEMIASGELPSIKVGGSVRVSVDGLRAWVDGKRAEKQGGATPLPGQRP